MNNLFKTYVESTHLVKKKQSVRYPDYFTLKYVPKVFYDNLWDSYLVELRGTVVDKDYNVKVLPFRKIFNRFETPESDFDRDHQVVAVRKINGFMAAATYIPEIDTVVVSTTGSLDSDHVRIAEKHITDEMKAKIKQLYFDVGERAFTFLFEVCDPEDQAHPIKEQHGIYLIGIRRVRWDSEETRNQAKLDDVAAELGCLRPEWFVGRFSDVVQHTKTCKHEGFVVYSEESYKAIKLKSPYYLTTKFIGRMKDTKLDDLTIRPDHYKAQLGEEYNYLVDKICATKEYFKLMTEDEKFLYVRGILNETTKD